MVLIKTYNFITKNFMHKSIDWCAGLFEGEGYLDTYGGYLRLAIEMTDRDVLEDFAAVFPGGTWYTRKRKDHWKETHRYQISKQALAKKALTSMLPLFGNRRAHKALDVLDHLELQT